MCCPPPMSVFNVKCIRVSEMKILNFKLSLFSVALAICVAGCAPVLPQQPSQSSQTSTSSQIAENPRVPQTDSVA
jgi:hypothetical protein